MFVNSGPSLCQKFNAGDKDKEKAAKIDATEEWYIVHDYFSVSNDNGYKKYVNNTHHDRLEKKRHEPQGQVSNDRG